MVGRNYPTEWWHNSKHYSLEASYHSRSDAFTGLWEMLAERHRVQSEPVRECEREERRLMDSWLPRSQTDWREAIILPLYIWNLKKRKKKKWKTCSPLFQKKNRYFFTLACVLCLYTIQGRTSALNMSILRSKHTYMSILFYDERYVMTSFCLEQVELVFTSLVY